MRKNGLLVRFEEDDAGRFWDVEFVRKTLETKDPKESLYAAVRRTAEGREYRPKCSSPEPLTPHQLKAEAKKNFVKRFGMKEEVLRFSYSLCPYECEGCNRKAISEIFKRDERRCRGCRIAHGLSIHHIVPRDEDGTNDPNNLITLCTSCHDYVECHEKKPRNFDSVLFYAQNRV